MLDLGAGHTATMVSQEGAAIPSGAVIRHGALAQYVRWATLPGDSRAGHVWTLDSLVPLTLLEPIVCTACGGVGHIVEGRWSE